LDNEAGAKSVIFNQSTDVAEYSFIDGAIDIDPPADYERLIRGSS